jgi:hypothetical protein
VQPKQVDNGSKHVGSIKDGFYDSIRRHATVWRMTGCIGGGKLGVEETCGGGNFC